MTNFEQVVPHWYMYPPKTAYSHAQPFQYRELGEATLREVSFYVHIPFCNMKCSFCSLFTSSGYSEEAAVRYVDSLVKEISDASILLKHGDLTVPSLYFGGGTPGLLDGLAVDRICAAFSDLTQARIASKSVEFSPDLVNDARMAHWLRNGFERISIGVQSFSDERLSGMRRQHSSDDAILAIDQAVSAGFEDVNVDLIFGHINQTERDWEHDLDLVTASGATSCTFHPLATVEKTPFEKKPSKKSTTFEKLGRLQRKAYEHFSRKGWVRTSAISYSRIGKRNPLEGAEARGASTLGFGAGSRTYLPSLHISTVPADARSPFGSVLKAYYDSIDSGKKPALASLSLNEEEAFRRRLILQLHHGAISIPKENHGVDQNTFDALVAYLDDLAGRNLLVNREGIYCVTDEGALSAARIGAELASSRVRNSMANRAGNDIEFREML